VTHQLFSRTHPLTSQALLALLRLAALPVILVGERLVPYQGRQHDLFLAVFAAAAVYGAITAWRAWSRPGDDAVPVWQLALDLVLLSALAYTSGGPFSHVRHGFFAVPVAAALLARPQVTATASVAAVGAYLAVALLHPAGAQSQAPAVEGAQVAYLLWAGLAATLVSLALARRASEVAALAASRGRLVAQTLDAEDHYRRELAEALHDEAIQNLLAARQELSPGRLEEADLTRVRLGLDRTVAQLRGAVFDLHPYLLEHAGLGPALAAVAEDSARRGGFVPDVHVDPGLPKRQQQLLFSVGRELIRNVARHAAAEHLRLSVTLEPDAVVLVAEDDGRGFDHSRLPSAPLKGHIGLASMAERVEAVGGTFAVNGAPGAGTRVEVRIPREPAAGDPGPAMAPR
jgi:two-component system NarL family sensor kinase